MSVNIKQNGELIKIANNASIVQADWNDRENPNKNTCIKNQPETIKTLEEINSNANENSLAGATAVKELNNKLEFFTTSEKFGVKSADISNNIYLNDSADSKIVEMSLYGKVKQNTTTGKNLIPYPYLQENITFKGITYVSNYDGSISVSGTPEEDSSYLRINTITLGKGKSYKISANSNNDNVGIIVRTSDSSSYANCYSNSEATLTVGEDTEYLIFVIVRGNVTINEAVTMYPMLRFAEIEDNTWEPYTGGLPSPNPDYPQDIEVSGESYNLIPYPYTDTTKTVNGVTFTDNKDGTITVNGTATGVTYFSLSPWDSGSMYLDAGEYIYSGCPVGGSSSTYGLGSADHNNANFVMDFGTGNKITMTDRNKRGAYIIVYKGATLNNIIFKPMLRKASVKNDRYMPYGKGSVEVTSLGKNYYDINKTTSASSALLMDTNDNSIRVYNTSEATFVGAKFVLDSAKIKIGKTYTFSADVKYTSGSGRLVLRSKDGTITRGTNIIKASGKYSFTFVMQEVGDYLTLFCTGKTAEIGDVMYSNIQLEEGQSISEYETYKETISTIPTENGLAGIPVDSGGNYTDSNGQQWICDEIVKYADGSGEYIQRTGKEVFDGSTDESWDKSGIASNISYYISKTTSGSFNAGDGGLGLLCNRFQVFKTKDLVEKDTVGCSYGYEGRGELRIGLGLSSEVNTVDLFRTWLSNNPVEMVYQLKTPSRTPLTAEQLAEIEKLSTFYPVTNISNDFDCEMSVLYVLHGKNSDYISTLNNSMHSHLNKQILDKITGVLDTASTIKANTTSGKVAGALGVKELYNELKNSFQDGCDTIVSGVTAQGVTPASNSPADIKTAINTVATNKYNAGVKATKVGTAAPGQVLNGKTFTNSSTVGATGTMPNNGGTTQSVTPSSDASYIYLPIPANGYYNTSSKLRCGAVKSKTFNNQLVAQTGNQTITVEKQWTADVTGRLIISVMYTSFTGVAYTQATCICNVNGVEQTSAADVGSGWDRNVVYSMLVTKGQKITCKTVLPETGNATHSVGQSWNVCYVS